MKVELRKWCLADKKELKELCNAAEYGCQKRRH